MSDERVSASSENGPDALDSTVGEFLGHVDAILSRPQLQMDSDPTQEIRRYGRQPLTSNLMDAVARVSGWREREALLWSLSVLGFDVFDLFPRPALLEHGIQSFRKPWIGRMWLWAEGALRAFHQVGFTRSQREGLIREFFVSGEANDKACWAFVEGPVNDLWSDVSSGRVGEPFRFATIDEWLATFIPADAIKWVRYHMNVGW